MSNPEDVIPSDIINQLMILGMTQYQAKIYRSVFVLKECSIQQIALHSGVPNAKIYSVIRELERKGLIIEIPTTRPVKFQAIPLYTFLKKNMNRLETVSKKITNYFKNVEQTIIDTEPSEPSEILLIKNEAVAKDFILNTIKPLTQEILFIFHEDSEFYEQIMDRLIKERLISKNSPITIIILDPYERNLELFTEKYSDLNFIILSGKNLPPFLLETFIKTPLFFIIDDQLFINITPTEKILEYFFMKSNYFTEFIKSLIKTIINLEG